jgi:hypothetical protein
MNHNDEELAAWKPPTLAEFETLEDYNPWATGEQLLNQVHAFLKRYIAYPSEEASIAHALWVSHAHLMNSFEATPRIAFLSPEKASGKTRALEVTANLVPNAVESINATPAYLIRKIGNQAARPTLLYDEIDTVFGPKAKKDNEDVRAILNAGHRKGATSGRCIVQGRSVLTEEIPAYCAVALAGLGWLPDTLLSRCIIIRMRRRKPSEKLEPYRRRTVEPKGYALRDDLADWAGMVGPAVEEAILNLDLPNGIEDRDADVWEPLIAVADTVGGKWPQAARVAAVALVALSKEEGRSLGVQLLDDIRTVFGEKLVMSTKGLLDALCNLDESIWKDIRGTPLNDRGLAHQLKQYGIKSHNVRIGENIHKGYAREDFHEAWECYLPLSPQENATSATSATNGRDDDGDPLHDNDPFESLKNPSLNLKPQKDDYPELPRCLDRRRG